MTRPLEILLAEDDPGDVMLTRRIMEEADGRTHLTVVSDGEEALEYLRRQGAYTEATRPDLLLLDLNMPRLDGREVLAELKADDDLRSIPVVVLTTSSADADIERCYSLHANCFVTKPLELEHYRNVIQSIRDFWLGTANLPAKH